MNNKKNDVFADLLSGGPSNSKKNNLPLTQLGNPGGNTPRNNQNTLLDLDFLDDYVSSKQATPTPPPATGDLLDDFGFESLNVSSKPKVQQQQQEPDLIIDTSRDQLPIQQQPSKSTSKRDHALAELLDMGFPLESANVALDSTPDGQNLDMAISYLMSNAPRVTTNSTNHYDNDMPQYANDFSSDLFNKASSIFNLGKKKLQKELNTYMSSNQRPSNGMPAWMEKAEIYKSHQNTIIDEHGEPEIDHDQIKETMNTLNQRQNASVQKSLLDDFDFDSPPQQPKPAPVSNPSSQSIRVNHRRQRKPQEQQQTVNTPKKYALNIPQLSSNQSSQLSSLREQAGKSFKLGDYPLTIELYQKSLKNLPNGHPLQVMFHSNLALVYSKLGNPKDQLESSVTGLELICSFTETKPNISELSKLEIEPGKNLKSFWIKLLQKKAESLEALEKWGEAKPLYDELISMGESTKSILDGKAHCVKALTPKKPANNTPKPKPRASEQQPTKVQQDAVNKIRRDNITIAQNEAKKIQYHDQTQQALDSWRSGNENNIRALICSLDKILWPELGWKPVGLTDLVLDKKVKIQYMKAVAKVHPDKIPQGTPVEKKMIAEGVFVTLNQAWESWKNSK